jgi:antitoxin HicB
MQAGQVTYSLVVQEQEGGYLAYFPALSGCSTWGSSYEEAVRNAAEALAVYLESLGVLGKPLPQEIDAVEPVMLGVTVKVPVAR